MDINKVLSKLFGNKSTRDMKLIQPWVEKVKAAYPAISALDNDALRAKTKELQQRIQGSADDLKEKIAELKGKQPGEVEVPVIGGHSGVTILPLLSQVPGVSFTEQEVADLTKRIQNAGTEVVEAKAGGGSATLSMGQAAARFGLSLVRALQGEQGVVECAYVEGDGQYARFFSQPLLLGKNGVEERKSIGTLSAFEQNALEGMLDTLKKDIALGEEFVNK